MWIPVHILDFLPKISVIEILRESFPYVCMSKMGCGSILPLAPHTEYKDF